MPFKRRFKDKYAGSSPENASVVQTLFDFFSVSWSEDVSQFCDYNEFCDCNEFYEFYEFYLKF